jgi:glycyl-tRNA synthetase beta chain
VLLRVQALANARASADFEAIATSFKRIKNILRQAQEKSGKLVESRFDPALASDDAERALHQMVEKTAPEVARFRREKDYGAALSEVAKLRPTLDTFFDTVMVMVEDARVRENRLALLAEILRDFSTIADFSEIVSKA